MSAKPKRSWAGDYLACLALTLDDEKLKAGCIGEFFKALVVLVFAVFLLPIHWLTRKDSPNAHE